VKHLSSRWHAFGLVVVLAVPALLGCDRSKGKPSEATAPGDPCKEAMQRLEKQQVELQKLNKASPPSAEDLAIQHKVFAAMANRCSMDKWPQEVIACMGKSSSVEELEKCDAGLSEAQRDQLGRAIAGAFGIEKQFETSKEQLATVAAKKLAFEAFPMWAMAHPDAACPAGIDALAEYMNGTSDKDPWGNAYRMRCGAGLPEGAKGIAISSDGPDGKPDTADDLTSW
jgi:hypothetical protein